MQTTTSAATLLPLARVLERTGLSHSTVWRLRRRGQFPEPLAVISRCDGLPSRVAWLASDIDAWVAARRVAPVPSPIPPSRPSPRVRRGRPRTSSVEG